MLTIQNTSFDPFYNQALEEYLFHAFPEDDIFYLWQNRPSVVVGRYQNICREVPVYDLLQWGIPVVRRTTGGGTVYHDPGNVNYTYMYRGSGRLNYDEAMTPIIEALNAIGVPARKDRTCDIVIGNRKISGSAQRMEKNHVLHHGTLLFSSDLALLDQITTQKKNDCFQSKGTPSAICRVTNIQEHLKEPMSLDAFRKRLLMQMVPADCPCITLTQEQQDDVRRLRDEKYRSWAWTWGKNPAFTYEKNGMFRDRPIRVFYQVKRGYIDRTSVESSVLDGCLAARRLDGARLEPERIIDVCRQLAGDDAEDLVALFL